jgi:hypothetical protein
VLVCSGKDVNDFLGDIWNGFSDELLSDILINVLPAPPAIAILTIFGKAGVLGCIVGGKSEDDCEIIVGKVFV